MNWKKRLTNYNFWISIVSAVLLILQAFDISFDIAYINEIVTAVLGLLVVIGIINDPTKTNKDSTTNNQSSNSNTSLTNESSQNDESELEIESNQTESNLNENSNVIETEKRENVGVDNIPNESEHEDNIRDSENDYEVLVNKIYSDLNEMRANLEKIYSSNKIDITKECVDKKIFENKNKKIVTISTKTGEGIEELLDTMVKIASNEEIKNDGELLVINTRHKVSVIKAQEALKKAIDTIEAGMPIDVIAIYIKEILEELGKITGETVTEDIINEIFSKFCLGK